VGADGSGKSTLIEDLEKWLSWKLSVRRIYYGIPKSKLIEIASRLINGFRRFKMVRLASVLNACLWVLIARNRYVLSLHAEDAAVRGNIVISDRFPLKEFHTMAEPMDGPRLKERTNLRGSLLSSMESRYYSNIQLPDRLFVLKVTLDEVRKRKSDLELESHEAKVKAVNNLQDNNYLVSIDANEPYENVLLKVKTMIWELL
jgi:thymidylate kinase